MSDTPLDDKLKAIMAEHYEPILNNADEWLPAIKQAFTDADYVRIPQVEVVTRWERGSKPEVFMVNGKEVMTGQEWYDRFKAEYGDDANYCTSIDVDCTCDLMNLAKRAAGINETKEHN